MENETIETPVQETVEAVPTEPTEQTEAPVVTDEVSPMSDIANAKEEEVLYANKYNSIEELEKGYNSLNDLYEERVGKMPPEENYDYEEAFKQAGIEVVPYEDNTDGYKDLFDNARAAGFNQDQFNAMIQIGGSWVREQVQRNIPQVDEAAEYAKLEQAWGEGAKGKAQEVAKWASANLPSDVFHKPLYSSAEGMKFLHSLYTQGQNVTPITDSERATSLGKEDIEVQISDIMKHPEYFKNSKASMALQEKVRKLISQQV